MFPNGLGNRNGLLGTRILEHVVTTFTAQLPKKERSKHPIHTHNPFKLNAEPHGFYLPPFNICKKGRSEQSNGYGIQGTISPDTGLFYLGAFGETTCFDSNRIRLSETLKDRYGLAAPEIEFSWSSNDMSIYKEMVEAISDLVEVFEDDCGIKLERPMLTRIHKELTSIGFPLPGSNHECGGARMGNDPKSSVVDPFNRLWDAPNIIVCDAACFPSIPHQNPTLTTMAIATRAARALHSSKHISTQVRV